jgi:hypothetical protein
MASVWVVESGMDHAGTDIEGIYGGLDDAKTAATVAARRELDWEWKGFPDGECWFASVDAWNWITVTEYEVR